jgi:hypothetical protein
MNTSSPTRPKTPWVSFSSRVPVSSQSSISSNSETENPFMTLVDAATSLLDKPEGGPHTVSPVVTKIPAAVEVEVPSTRQKDEPRKKQTFAELLMTVVEDPANQDVITWMPDGKAFTIKNHKKFTRNSMPKLFNIRNMSSFVRKLGRWGFQRVHEKETRNSDIFKHPKFQRGKWELCRQVRCVGRLNPAGSTRAAAAAAAAAIRSSPSSPKAVFDLPTDGMMHLRRESASKPASPTSILTARIPSPPALVSPPTTDKALYRLEQARRRSAISRPPSFTTKRLGNMTSEVMTAALETLRRDEETVLVAMPRRLLGTRHTPGIRVLTDSSAFAPRESAVYRSHHYHRHEGGRHRSASRSSSIMTLPSPSSHSSHPRHHVSYARVVPAQAWAYGYDTYEYESYPPPQYHRVR